MAVVDRNSTDRKAKPAGDYVLLPETNHSALLTGEALDTVKVHRGRVMTKTGVDSLAELVRAGWKKEDAYKALTLHPALDVEPAVDFLPGERRRHRSLG